MYFNKSTLDNLDKQKKVNIINSITGIKPANLIATISEDGRTNVAIFSSVVHLGSNPALIGFIMRPIDGFERHTYINILQQKYYTINHVPEQFIEAAHLTSGKYPNTVSEFTACNLTEEYHDNFLAPYVKESKIKTGLKFSDAIILPNKTILIIGEIENIITHPSFTDEEGNFDLTQSSIGVSGTDTYYTLEKKCRLPYVTLRHHETN